MRNAVVGTKSQVSTEELRQLLQTRNSAVYYFRYVDRVEGFCTQLTSDKLSPEGQAFDQKTEIRWKQFGDIYDVLWLAIEPETLPEGFEAIEGKWCCDDQDLQTKVYPETETRLPRGVPSVPQKIDIKQRYFRDRTTSTIHFTALTI